MESTVSNQIIDVLNALCEKFGIAIDWTSQNVMPYIQELMKKAVNYELWTSIGWIVIWAIFIFVFFKSIHWYIKNRYNKNNRIIEFITDDEYFFYIGSSWFLIIGGIWTIISIIGAVTQIMDIITCLTFPEKIIFNMIQSML